MRFRTLNRRISRLEENLSPKPVVRFEDLSPEDKAAVLDVLACALDAMIDMWMRGEGNADVAEFFRVVSSDHEIWPQIQKEIQLRQQGQAGGSEERVARARVIVSRIMGA